MTQHAQCLNCDHSLNNKYCPACGQKADTHRITTHHFIFHDLVHGVWHLDKGILFTLKEAIIRPGKAAVDYIKGKRVRYYNIFYLTLLLLGLLYLSLHWTQELHPEVSIPESSGDGVKISAFVKQNAKALIFAFVPFSALNGWLLFRRARYNYAEHNLIGGFILLSIIILVTFMSLLNLLPPTWIKSPLLLIPLGGLSLAPFIYPCIAYYQAFRPTYARSGLILRIMALYLLYLIELILLAWGIILLVSGKGGFNGSFKL